MCKQIVIFDDIYRMCSTWWKINLRLVNWVELALALSISHDTQIDTLLIPTIPRDFPREPPLSLSLFREFQFLSSGR